MRRSVLFFSILLTTCTALVGCYRPPISQGNVMTDTEVRQIHPGMTSTEVKSLLGDPVLNNTFDNGQLSYVYSYHKAGASPEIKRVIIFFSKDHVTKVSVD